MITLTDYWEGRDELFPALLTDEIKQNASIIVAKANLLLSAFREDTGDTEQRHVTSGWRPPAVNAATPGAAPRSKHMSAQAIDLADPEGDLDQWVFEHPQVLERIGLFQEHPSCTARGWAHFQFVPPKSGRRVFFP